MKTKKTALRITGIPYAIQAERNQQLDQRLANRHNAISIPLLVPSLNVLLRMHWAKRRQLKQTWAWAFAAAQPKLVGSPFRHVMIHSQRPRLLDYDNLCGGCKECVVDNLKDFGWIADDSPDAVTIWYYQNQGKDPLTVIAFDGGST